ncbi:MAG: hypothetical protein ACOZIN_21045 [Myxococcota bacterium]
MKIALALAAGLFLSAEPSKKKLRVDLDLPSFGALPTDAQLEKPKEKKLTTEPTTTISNATYQVVKVMHARQFMRGAGGSTPVGGQLEIIARSGNPPSTERFHTVVRVTSKERLNAPIDLVVLDPRGDTLMTASGEVIFRGSKQDEVDYLVEWEPTPTRAPGNFQLLVRVGGQVMGTYPLKVVDQATGAAAQ